MSRIIFICSGNTCRSPMAEGIARRMFGQTHTITSAGAETDSGREPAKNAVAACQELGVDISGHRTVSVDSVDLSTFDLIVIMRPSEAEALPVSPGAVVDHLDVADPYGENLGVYRRAARTVLKGTRRLYVRDALRRVDGGTAGSHAAGVFNRAAKELEKEVFELAVDEIGFPGTLLTYFVVAEGGSGDRLISNETSRRDTTDLQGMALCVKPR